MINGDKIKPLQPTLAGPMQEMAAGIGQVFERRDTLYIGLPPQNPPGADFWNDRNYRQGVRWGNFPTGCFTYLTLAPPRRDITKLEFVLEIIPILQCNYVNAEELSETRRYSGVAPVAVGIVVEYGGQSWGGSTQTYEDVVYLPSNRLSLNRRFRNFSKALHGDIVGSPPVVQWVPSENHRLAYHIGGGDRTQIRPDIKLVQTVEVDIRAGQQAQVLIAIWPRPDISRDFFDQRSGDVLSENVVVDGLLTRVPKKEYFTLFFTGLNVGGAP